MRSLDIATRVANPAPLPTDDQRCRSWSSRSAAPTWRRTCRCSKRSSRSAARIVARRHGTNADVAPDVGFEVVVIGAGMSGLLAGHRLQQAGVPFVIIEKDDDVGGTWLENTYPGCRVDNPNHNYSYSFAQRHDWPLHFSTQDVLLDYFRSCADVFGLREHIRFATEVVSAVVRRRSDLDGAPRPRAGHEETIGRERGGQRGRPAQPPALPRHRGPRLVRGARVPFRALGRHRRPARCSRRGDRHRRQRGAVHPRDRGRGRRAARLPAHPAVARRDARLSRRGRARDSAGCTHTCRRTASGTASGSSGRWATACSKACASIPNGSRRTRR